VAKPLYGLITKPPPQVPEALVRLIQTCCAKGVSRRKAFRTFSVPTWSTLMRRL
jgi:hypothetical protein